MQIKTNKNNLITFKDITANQFMVMHALLMNVRLGCGEASENAYELLVAMDTYKEDGNIGGDSNVTVTARNADKHHQVFNYPEITVVFSD